MFIGTTNLWWCTGLKPGHWIMCLDQRIKCDSDNGNASPDSPKGLTLQLEYFDLFDNSFNTIALETC